MTSNEVTKVELTVPMDITVPNPTDESPEIKLESNNMEEGVSKELKTSQEKVLNKRIAAVMNDS